MPSSPNIVSLNDGEFHESLESGKLLTFWFLVLMGRKKFESFKKNKK